MPAIRYPALEVFLRKHENAPVTSPDKSRPTRVEDWRRVCGVALMPSVGRAAQVPHKIGALDSRPLHRARRIPSVIRIRVVVNPVVLRHGPDIECGALRE